MNITDEQLRQYVDNVFQKYDKNGNYTLDQNELYLFFKDLFASMNFKQKVTMEDVKHSMKQIDANHDGKITKKELYNALKLILGGGKPGTPGKQPNLPFQYAKQPKNQEPPKQQPGKHNYQQQQQQQQHHQQQQQQQHKKQTPSNQAYDYNQHPQKQQQQAQQQLQQQQKKQQGVQKQVKVAPQLQNQAQLGIMKNIGFGMMGGDSFYEMGPGMGFMGPPPGMMGPMGGMNMGGMGPMGGMGGFGFW